MNSTLMRISKELSVEVEGLGDRIKDARIASRRKTTELAYLAGISASYWYSVENGSVRNLPYETLRNIEQALGVDFGVNFNE